MASSMGKIKRTTGKTKIAIEPITNKNKKQVTFSKRRVGLFKKANDLSLTCGADIAVITFSPAGKLFSFGNPNSDDVIHRFFQNDDIESKIDDGKLGSFSDDIVANECLPRGQDCDYKNGYWWDRDIDDMKLSELEEFKVALEGLRDDVATKIGVSSKINNNNSDPISFEVPQTQSSDFYIPYDESLLDQTLDEFIFGNVDYIGTNCY
ncbi:unnamed protein product [Amaranthus hypochondriacus]